MKLPRLFKRLLAISDAPSDSLARAAQSAGHVPGPNTERGMRSTPENALKALYRQMWVDPELRATILDIRAMDKADPRVKKIHARMSRTAVKGGLLLEAASSHKRLHRQWCEFQRRLGLSRQEKLESDCRGLVMEGNLPMQWVLDADNRVLAGIRMPTETLVPKVLPNGRFVDPGFAYEQYDLAQGLPIAKFALWQLSLVRLTPDNWDDMGCFGRPYLDASRTPWRKLIMTEEDLVIRRRHRAPLRMAHVLEGAADTDLIKYRAEVEQDQTEITTDYYLNRKGSVTALQGDANLDQVEDVVLLLDAFFAGAPAPKGLFGYTKDMARDILEDLKRDYYDEIDALQDTLSYVYELGFRLDLLLQGINPDSHEFSVKFAERRTETPNQAADRALKWQALGASRETIFRAAGLDPTKEREQLEEQARNNDPYPDPQNITAKRGNGAGGAPRVSVTPGNQPKGESATTISTRN
jgi:hypothetical protein